MKLYEYNSSQRSCMTGIDNRTYQEITARTSDGKLYWRGWFEDRDDADEFLFQLINSKIISSDVRKLPKKSSQPHTFVEAAWYPAMYEGEWNKEFAELPLTYYCVTHTYLTSTGSGTYTKPTDWNDGDNYIRGIGGR